MSWHIQYDGKAAFLADHRTFESGTPSEDQLHEARAAAEQIINSGCVGTDDKDFLVAIFGHANADHAPTIGWANDCVSVSVTQKAFVPSDATATAGATR